MSLKLLLLQDFKQNLWAQIKLTTPIQSSSFDKKIDVLDMLLPIKSEEYDMKLVHKILCDLLAIIQAKVSLPT